jgi:glycosyltransferase involved in cell wall biosynthesis
MDLSVVIPVYRSAALLPPLIDRLVPVLLQTGLQCEICFIDDGSPDDSWRVIRQLHDLHPDLITAVQLMRNFGQHNALMCGFRHSRGRLIVTIDDDLQNPPEEIPKLLEAIERTDRDVVYGIPAHRAHAEWRNAGSRLVGTFFRFVFKTTAGPSAFKIMRRELVQSILTYDLNFTYVDGLLAWNTQRAGVITVEHHLRLGGRSGYDLPRLVVLSFNLFTNFSLLPLQFISAIGMLAALGGFVTAFYYVVEYFRSQTIVPGYASIIVSVLIMGGLQLMAMGIMGEYLGRVLLNANRKPQYVERSVLDAADRSEKKAGLEPDDRARGTADSGVGPRAAGS